MKTSTPVLPTTLLCLLLCQVPSAHRSGPAGPAHHSRAALMCECARLLERKDIACFCGGVTCCTRLCVSCPYDCAHCVRAVGAASGAEAEGYRGCCLDGYGRCRRMTLLLLLLFGCGVMPLLACTLWGCRLAEKTAWLVGVLLEILDWRRGPPTRLTVRACAPQPFHSTHAHTPPPVSFPRNNPP